MTQITIMADAIVDMSVQHGVVRLNLGQQGPDGKPIPSGQLVLPVLMLPIFGQSIHNLLQQIEAKHREQQAAAAAAGSANPPAAPAAGGAFRFG